MSWTDSASALAQSSINFSAWLSLLLGCGYFLSRTGKSRTLAVLFLLLGVLLLHGYLVLSRRILDWPWLLHMHVPVLFFLGPVSFRWICDVIKDNTALKWPDFVPGVLVTLVLLPFYFSPAEYKRSIALAFYDGTLPWTIRSVFVLALGSYAIYLARSLRLIVPLLRSSSFREDHNVRIAGALVAYAGLVTLIAVASLFANRPAALHIMLSGLALFPPVLYLITARYPDLFFQLQTAAEKGRYEYSRLGGQNLDALKARLSALMETESLYSQEDLTLEEVALRLGLTPHALSEFFNSHLKINFPGYINALRIDAACRLLEQDPSRTVLSAAYEVGFSAKSTFNAAFLRHRGMSPTAFRAEKKRGGRASRRPGV